MCEPPRREPDRSAFPIPSLADSQPPCRPGLMEPV